MKTEPEKNIRVRATLENLERIVEFVIACAGAEGLTTERISDLHLAVDEACTNIIKYAYPAGEPGELEVSCRRSGDSVSVTIRDWGRPFDPIASPPPDLDLDLDQRPIGGLGIFLMKKFTDGLRYSRQEGCNLLRITKNIR